VVESVEASAQTPADEDQVTEEVIEQRLDELHIDGMGSTGMNGHVSGNGSDDGMMKKEQPYRAVSEFRWFHAQQGYWYKYYSSGPWMQLKTNIWRQYVLTRRNKGAWLHQFMAAIVLGFFLGSLFYNQGIDRTSVQSRIGLLLFMLAYTAFNSLSLVPVLAEQRQVFYQQKARSYHTPTAYYVSFVIIQFPIVLMESFLLIMPIWGLAGLSGWPFIGDRFWFAYLALATHALVARAWTMFLAGR
jgi:hypothetical protein